MQRVSGIGGFFFRAKDPEKLSEWYEKYLGINGMKSNEVWMQYPGPTVFAPFPEDTEYFGSKNQQSMINFRINDLDAMVEQLENAGINVDEKRIDEKYGKFASIYDPEGNKIELWEPADERWKDGVDNK